jgi:hypothetical protein
MERQEIKSDNRGHISKFFHGIFIGRALAFTLPFGKDN